MHKNKKINNTKQYSEKLIKKTINNEFKNNHLQKFFKDIEIFSNLTILEKNINKKFDLCMNGHSVAIPVINKFLVFKDGVNHENINEINKKHKITSLFITNHKDYLNTNGINALDISYASLTDTISWGESFEDFLNTKELKITKWIDPIEQLISCIRISEIFECYFDIHHHTMAAATLLFMDNELLEKFLIKRSVFDAKKYSYLEENLTDTKLKSFFKKHRLPNEYIFIKNAGYPYIHQFAKTLPSNLNYFLNESINIFSSQTKKDFLNKFKKADYVTKLLIIIYRKKDISTETANGFKDIYKHFGCKKLLIDEIANIEFDEFELAIKNYIKITKNVNKNNSSIKKLFSKGIFKELINYSKDSEGPIIKSAIGFIPNFNNLISDTIEYKNYEIKQVKSLQELISVGKEYNNCLKNYEQYHRALKVKGLLFIAFRIKSKKNGYGSFVAHISLKDRYVEILEMQRKQNRPCSNEERFILQEFLVNQKLIDIPEEFYGQFMMKLFYEIVKKDFESGVSNLIEKAPVIFNLLQRLKNNRYWLHNYDNESLTQDIENLLLKNLNEQSGLKRLKA